MQHTIRLILVTSKKARSGKDTLVDILYNKFKQHRQNDSNEMDTFSRIRFADPLIRNFKNIFGYDWDKSKHIPGVREQLIAFSAFCKGYNPNVWIDNTIRDVEDEFEHIEAIMRDYFWSTHNIFFTDCRYQYEYNRLKTFLDDFPFKTPLLKELLLIEVTDGREDGKITDRDTPEDALMEPPPDLILFNPKTSLADFEAEIDRHIDIIDGLKRN